MMADTAMALQVWIDTRSEPGQTVLTPYIKSAQAIQVDYSMSLSMNGKSGKSRINQGGKVNAAAATPTALSRMRIHLRQEDACDIELVLRNGGKELGTYHFDCQR